MKKLVIAGMSVFCMMGTVAQAAVYDLVTTSTVDRSRSSEANTPQKNFALNSKVYAFLTLRDFNETPKSVPRTLEARWYSCDRLVSKRDLTLNEAFKQSAKSGGDDVHHAWFWIDAKPMGSGQHKVEVYSDGQLAASTNFNVYNEAGDSNTCAGNAPQTYSLGDSGSKNVLFKFNRSQESDLYGAGQIKLDEIAQNIKQSYRSINKMVVVGHTDRLGDDAYNLKLSQERANTIKNALLLRGVNATEVEIIGKGETTPLSECAPTLQHEQLIECLAPNRRVDITIYGDKINKP